MTAFGKLTRRDEFTAARKGRRSHASAFTAQIVRRADADAATGPRAGLTVTKKIGDAVVRNRIKRRLRAALRAFDAATADPVSDHVFIAKREALTISFAELAAEMAAAVGPRAPKRRAPDPSRA
ncbi:ribonuclease P protein component [Terrarubrum flagellatum]|uniref:ribonuclease P protein component n=1 Tax=Terrirubrum flagellatum TaxID=2895980 RepID=UPI00314520A1